MDVLGPFLHLVLRSLVVLFPMAVGWLAFRRLALSHSPNAWIYAAMFLFAAVTTAAVLPWTLGLSSLNWLMLLLALVSPAIWIAVTLLCDVARSHRYDMFASRNDDAEPGETAAEQLLRRLSTLPGREEARPQSAPVAMFRHRAEPAASAPEPSLGYSATTKTLLGVARDIRDNPTSERHRPKLLASPESRELPFLEKVRGG